MTYLKLVDINGLGSNYFKKLSSAGITSTQSLYEKCTTLEGRLAVSKKSKISLKLVLRWINKLDLLRLEGIGADFWKLLETSDIISVDMLARQNPNELLQKFEKINHEKNITKRNPSLWEVENWISQAKILPKLMENTDASLSFVERRDVNYHLSPETHLLYYVERLKQKNFGRRVRDQNFSNSLRYKNMNQITQTQ